MKLINTKFSPIFLVCFVLGIGGINSVSAQKVVNDYDIVLAGFTIGNMKAHKITEGASEDYQIHSKVEFWFFGKIHVEFLQNVNFQNDQLMKATTKSDSNRGNFVTTVNWNKDHYDVDANSYKFHNEESIDQAVFGTPAKLYFHEPKDGDELISENFGMLTKVIELEKGVYEIDVNGNTNTFHYENGILQKVVLENNLKNYSIKRKVD
ncbi:DUF6134 family protein [Algoriphagus sp. D3-2-R+10]|uniref:DUF6134 family protein n=1 Tax=Algoriphagus aurantiacus TaxID=3103948 RepID=UPI002B3FEE4E|nr:DUF6134 family protein [Algoriphagus sp. D3-2-R+10]MEB2775291.1 DUF6134 family protein [Algoriphagus sp. D3-2-R+10]